MPDWLRLDVPIFVAQKRWVDRALFFEAFEVAVHVHEGQYPGKVDPDLLRASFAAAQLQPCVISDDAILTPYSAAAAERFRSS